MKSEKEFNPVIICCPNCNLLQAAIVEHTFPWATFIHECVGCKYTIMESEWNEVEPFLTTDNN